MLLIPAIISLTSGELLTCGFSIYASVLGIQIIRWWDIRSGSERLLALENKTYLITTILVYLSGFELFSLFFFVNTTDYLHDLFVGAMCAAGSLNVNDFGYSTLLLKVITFILCGIWLIVKHIDNQGADDPLIMTQYKYLIVVAGLLVSGTVFQIKYFTGLNADVITSCCGTLFSEDAGSIAGALAALASSGTKILFFLSMALTIRTGVYFFITARAAKVFSGLAVWTTIPAIVALISFIPRYVYELPTHHCPFCLLQKEYRYIGYPLYPSLFLGGITGASVGLIEKFKGISSVKEMIPRSQKRFCLISMIGFTNFTMISIYPMVFSDFVLEKY